MSTHVCLIPRLEREAQIIVRTCGYLRSWQGNQAPDFKVLSIYPRFALLAWVAYFCENEDMAQ